MNGNYQARAARIMERIHELAAITEEAGMIKRVYATEAFMQAGNMIMTWMREAGLAVRKDNIGNLRARLHSSKPAARTLITGSHYDTVINAGAFDGPLGILISLDAIEAVIRSNTQLPFHAELIAFCDEEGVRFHTTYLGSKAVAGLFDPELLNRTDAAGIQVREAIRQTGGDPDSIGQDTMAGEDLLGYFEVHIEQGPVLYESGNPVAVVTAIAGQKRLQLSFTGVAGHAGTVPMHMRRDALACAAACITAVEAFATVDPDTMIATIGKLDIPGAASNVIAGSVTCTLDIRSISDAHLTAAWQSLQHRLEEICNRRNITFTATSIQESSSVTCDAGLNRLLGRSVSDAGYGLVELPSGAGHDAVPLSAICPVCMLFVRCFKGISHHPLEAVELNDIAAALQVVDNFLQQLSTNNQ